MEQYNDGTKEFCYRLLWFDSVILLLINIERLLHYLIYKYLLLTNCDV